MAIALTDTPANKEEKKTSKGGKSTKDTEKSKND